MTDADFLEFEKIYTQAKSDEFCMRELCEDQDSRVFDYVYECGERIEKIKGKFSSRLKSIALETQEEFNKTNNPACFDNLLSQSEETFNSFFDTVMAYLKKMYSKA